MDLNRLQGGERGCFYDLFRRKPPAAELKQYADQLLAELDERRYGGCLVLWLCLR